MVVDLRCALNDGRLLDGYCAAEYGRFLFARSVVGQTPLACLSVLDGQEPNLIRMIATLHGDPGQTGYATYVRDRDKTAAQPPSVIPAYAQHQYVRDAVAFDSRWLSRLSQLSPPPSPPAAPAPARSFATKVKGRLKRIAKAALGRV